MAKKLNQVSEDYRKIKKWTEKDPVNYFVVIILVFLFIFLLINLPGIYSVVLGVSGKFKMNSMPTISIPTDVPTPSFTETPTPTEAPYIAPTRDPDPPVLCNVNSNCGGGTTPLRQSECNNSTCCQIGDKWIFYKDKNQCTQDQNNYYKNSSNSYVPPAYIPLPTYAPLPTYQPYVAPTTDPQVAIDQHNSQVEYCRSSVSAQYSDLIRGCSIRFGDSSAAEGCTHTYESQRQSAYNACGSTY